MSGRRLDKGGAVIPCVKNSELSRLIEAYAETLKREAHTIGDHGLDETEFHRSGLFRGAIERLRGQQAATMMEKREFVAAVLDHMTAVGAISEWRSAGEANRHDYQVRLLNGETAVIELKGCLDGNNTNIFERPPNANEFIIWSVCQNPGADPRHNAWSGLHSRLSAEIIDRRQVIDGVVIWDMLCGTRGRPCPKQEASPDRVTVVKNYRLPPPCLYLFPATVPSPRSNPKPPPQTLNQVGMLKAFRDAFGGEDEELTYVWLEASHVGAETGRRTRLVRGGVDVMASSWAPIQRA